MFLFKQQEAARFFYSNKLSSFSFSFSKWCFNELINQSSRQTRFTTMGQAFRRASGRIRATSQTDTSSFSNPKITVDHRPPSKIAADKPVETAKPVKLESFNDDDRPKANLDNILEERDPKFDAMLGQMLGRITSKPGGKLEMGEASLVERYNRPMPKLRNTKPNSAQYEERPVAAGTLNVAQLRHIILLHEGKADDHNGPMDVHQIAEKFRIDVGQIQKILQFLSHPPEGRSEDKNKTEDNNKMPR